MGVIQLKTIKDMYIVQHLWTLQLIDSGWPFLVYLLCILTIIAFVLRLLCYILYFFLRLALSPWIQKFYQKQSFVWFVEKKCKKYVSVKSVKLTTKLLIMHPGSIVFSPCDASIPLNTIRIVSQIQGYPNWDSFQIFIMIPLKRCVATQN